MDTSAAGSSIVCSADVAAFVDALETINYSEAECYDSVTGENVVICIAEEDVQEIQDEQDEMSVAEIEEACSNAGGNFFNPDTRKLKAIMQQLVAQKKAVFIDKVLTNNKGAKQFKSDVWKHFGDVQLLISESDALRLKIPYFIRTLDEESHIMICKVFVGCFKCNALFMYDAQKHSTSTLRYHVRACTRPKECIYVSEDKQEDEIVPMEMPPVEGQKQKRFRTDPRKQKEVIEQLFQKQRACITKKSFMNMKGNRRFKSDVWNSFGDVKLLISRSEAKKLKIPYYIRRCGDEQMVLSKIFVGCFKCMALFIHDSQKSTSTLRYHIRTCSRPRERKKRTQPNIIFFHNKDKTLQTPDPTDSQTDAILAHEKILNFTLSSECNMDVVQNACLQKILQMCITVGAAYGDVNVDSLLCATPTLKSFILNDVYVTSVNTFYTEFQYAYGATYRPVVWEDDQVKCRLISVHCSYIDSNAELKSVIIHTDDFDYEVKTVESVHEWFTCFLQDQPVTPFKRLISVDNDSNLVSALQDELCIKCVLQNITATLQVVSSRGAAGELPDFTNLLANCIDVIDHCDPVVTNLTKCKDDSWTSIVAMFRSMESQYDEILSVLNETNSTHMLSVDRPTIASIGNFFKVFEESMQSLAEVSEPTLHLVIPWVLRLQKHCAVDKKDSAALKQLKSNLVLEVNERLVKGITLYHRMATFLDPRFRKLTLGSASDNRDAHLKLKALVKECMESPNVDEMIYKVSNDAYDSAKAEKAALEEVDKYTSLSFHLIGPDLHQPFPLLKWWKDNSDICPNLCKIAMWLLSCPASSVGRDNTFYSNGWLVHMPRLPIPHEIVNKILFVKSFNGI